MYRLKEGIKPEELRKYGFKLGMEYPDNERCICNDSERDDFWLIPMNPDSPEKIYYADEEYDQPIWSVHVQPAGPLFGEPLHYRIWIECVPSCTYHIDNCDMEQMFFALYRMITDGILEDNYKEEDR